MVRGLAYGGAIAAPCRVGRGWKEEKECVCRKGAYVVTNGTGQEIRTAGERIESDRNG